MPWILIRGLILFATTQVELYEMLRQVALWIFQKKFGDQAYGMGSSVYQGSV